MVVTLMLLLLQLLFVLWPLLHAVRCSEKSQNT